MTKLHLTIKNDGGIEYPFTARLYRDGNLIELVTGRSPEEAEAEIMARYRKTADSKIISEKDIEL